MTATASLSPPPQKQSRRASPASIAAGAVLGTLAAIVLSLGALSLWSNSKADAAGYVHTGSDRFATTTHALATDDLDLNGAGWLVDQDVIKKVRVRADANNGKPLFVGVARSQDVKNYLAATDYAEVTDVDYSPFEPTYRAHTGGAVPATPAAQDFWAASTHGTGTQSLNWKADDGKWSVVVMNADGSRGVDARVSAGAKIDWLGPAGWALVGFGTLMLAGSVGLVVAGARRV
jgi:hypothetical protein